MTAQEIFNIAIGIICAGGGWWMRTVWDAVQDLKSEVGHLSVQLAQDYVAKEDFNRLADALFKKLDRIEDKLDAKVDKP